LGRGARYRVARIRALPILHHANPVCAFFEDRCPVPGTKYRVPAIWRLGPGTHTGAGPTPRAGHRAPRTELGHRKICTPGMQDRNGQDSDYRVPGTWYLAPLHHSPISNLNKARVTDNKSLPHCRIAPLGIRAETLPGESLHWVVIQAICPQQT